MTHFSFLELWLMGTLLAILGLLMYFYVIPVFVIQFSPRFDLERKKEMIALSMLGARIADAISGNAIFNTLTTHEVGEIAVASQALFVRAKSLKKSVLVAHGHLANTISGFASLKSFLPFVGFVVFLCCLVSIFVQFGRLLKERFSFSEEERFLAKMSGSKTIHVRRNQMESLALKLIAHDVELLEIKHLLDSYDARIAFDHLVHGSRPILPSTPI